MTGSLINALLRAQQAFLVTSPGNRFRMCHEMLDTLRGASGWDLTQPVDTGSGACSGTVTIDGECHYFWEVNYALFGVLNRLCGRSWQDGYTSIIWWKIGKTFVNLGEGDFSCLIGGPDALYEWTPSLHHWFDWGYKGPSFTPSSRLCCEGSETKGQVFIQEWPWPLVNDPLPPYDRIGDVWILPLPPEPQPAPVP